MPFRLLLEAALLRAIFDADVKEDTRKALDKEIETWDLRMV